MMDWDNTTQSGARAPGAERRGVARMAVCGGPGPPRHDSTRVHEDQGTGTACAKDGCKLSDVAAGRRAGRHRLKGQPWSRTGENPPYGILGETMETSASFEARSAPSSYPTVRVRAG